MSKKHFDIRRQGMPIFIALGALVVVNLVLWALLVRPRAAEYQDRVAGGEAAKQVDTYRDGVVRSEEFLTALGTAESDLGTLRSDYLGTRDSRMVEIQSELVRLCKEFRIDIDTVSYKNEILKEEGLDRFAMIVPLEGGYANLRRFLQAIEASEQFLVVERVALGEASRSQAGSLQLNITVGTYFKIDVPSKPKRGGAGA